METLIQDKYSEAIRSLESILEHHGKKAYDEAIRENWASPKSNPAIGCLFKSLGNGIYCPTFMKEGLKYLSSPEYIRFDSVRFRLGEEDMNIINRFPELKEAIINHPGLPDYTLGSNGRSSYPPESLSAFADIQRLADNLVPNK